MDKWEKVKFDCLTKYLLYVTIISDRERVTEITAEPYEQSQRSWLHQCLELENLCDS